MELILVIIIAISLSMDTFSLSLVYGTKGIKKSQIYTLAITVGTFHFFMPLIGMFLGQKIISIININPNILTSVILIVIAIQMITQAKENKPIKTIKKTEYFLFAIAVSLDSFSIGLTLTQIYKKYLISTTIFAVTSFLFTLIGLKIGNKIKKSIGQNATIIGGLVLIVIGLYFLTKM